MSKIKGEVYNRMASLLRLCPGTQDTDFVISSGCALALLGLRESFDDLDIAVSAVTFGRLVDLGFEVDVQHPSGKPVIRFASINADVHLSPEYMEKEFTIVPHGDMNIRILSAASLLDEKENLYQKLGLEKHKKDIVVLKAYINNQKHEGGRK